MQRDSRRSFSQKDQDRKRKETGNSCEICKVFEIEAFHHIKPHSLGGKSDYENMAGLCALCHFIADNCIKEKELKKYIEEGGLFWQVFFYLGAGYCFSLAQKDQCDFLRNPQKHIRIIRDSLKGRMAFIDFVTDVNKRMIKNLSNKEGGDKSG